MVSTMERETAITEAAIETNDSLSPSALSGAISAAASAMVERVRPSVVLVRSGGRGAGAGVIWRSDGGIITNAHVVAHTRGEVQVILADGRELTGKVVNSNPTLDLALLEVDAKDLPAALVADSSTLRVGELVFAVGHPWGQRDYVTAGIVSGLGNIGVPHTGRTAQYIRSDVHLAPGNSGGPLLNARGEVVGINAMVFGGDMGVAIPSHVATAWVAGPPSRRVYLGVGVRPVELPGVEFDFSSAWPRSRSPHHRHRAGWTRSQGGRAGWRRATRSRRAARSRWRYPPPRPGQQVGQGEGTPPPHAWRRLPGDRSGAWRAGA